MFSVQLFLGILLFVNMNGIFFFGYFLNELLLVVV